MAISVFKLLSLRWRTMMIVYIRSSDFKRGHLNRTWHSLEHVYRTSGFWSISSDPIGYCVSASRHMGVAYVRQKIFTSHLLFMVIMMILSFLFYLLFYFVIFLFFFPRYCHHCWLALPPHTSPSQPARTMHQTVISFDCSVAIVSIV
jgi:hypothetical protein